MMLGQGLDLVGVARFRRAVQRHGRGLLQELLTPTELVRCDRTADPVRTAATLFACKEALFKALGTGRSGSLRWHDVEVEPGEPALVESAGRTRIEPAGQARCEPVGWPRIELAGHTAEAARSLGVRRMRACLTTNSRQALAVVTLEGDPSGPGAGRRVGNRDDCGEVSS